MRPVNADCPSPELKREIEIALSEIDQAIQGLAVATKGSITIYDHDWPVRSVEVNGDDGVWRRILVEALWGDRAVRCIQFRILVDAWIEDEQDRFHWEQVENVCDDFPVGFSGQFH